MSGQQFRKRKTVPYQFLRRVLTNCVSLLVFISTLHFLTHRTEVIKRSNVMLIVPAWRDKRPTLGRRIYDCTFVIGLEFGEEILAYVNVQL